MEFRRKLLRVGLELMTEKGFMKTGLDEVLLQAGVAKGSFYHYFSSKEAFGIELIACYAAYFARRLEYFFEDESLSPLERIAAFAEDAENRMARFNYKRGCLVGNLGQEMNVLPESFRLKIMDIFEDWQARCAKCLQEARRAGEISERVDVDKAAVAFWIGWEGAVLRAKLEQRPDPLRSFIEFFLQGIAQA